MSAARVESIRFADDRLDLLDQRRLPAEERWLPIESAADATAAIRDLVVRGAPAIGITAAYACVLAARHRGDDRAAWDADLDALVAARPTAVNLRWAVERMRRAVEGSPGAALEALRAEARRLHREDRSANEAMAQHGAGRIEAGSTVLTHCNTGSLATGGTGTALGVIVRAWREQRLKRVLACETRPWLQGLRLTAWELAREGVPAEVLVEGAAAGLMQRERVDWVITGADRITANGDVANKVGTLMLAVLARRFGARMMVVAPLSTLDPQTPDGAGIEIEQREASEIWRAAGVEAPPPGVDAWNPVFDVTPAELIDCIVTEKGVIEPPFDGRIRGLFDGA
ncbi:S-methyl-5-thioribose-1-phosphate isomerase [Halomonas denitrificans]|nr:S-methyl-5-thioribose-1-phosphate isomerase [Halomonas denitrificans]